ncbi:MAG: histidine kinase [Bacteroidota bacterium]
MASPLPRPASPPWSRATEIGLVVGFWSVLGALALVRRQLDPRGPSSGGNEVLILTLAEYGLWALVTLAVFALVHRLRDAPGPRLGRLLLYVAVAFVVAVLVEWVRQSLFAAVFPEAFEARQRLGRGRGPFARGPRTPFEPGLEAIVTRLRFLDEFVIAVAVLIAAFARDALLRLRERESHAAHLEAQLADARLAALRMQLNPHFLFNTLHAVSALVERNPAGVRTMIARLSALLRRVLDGGDRHEIPLREELALVRDYLAIQQVRLGDRLVWVETVDDDVLDALVPALVLQPLAENAVGHGIARIEGTGRIVVEARREGGDVILAIRDNGPGPGETTRELASGDDNARSGGLGLSNTRQRLRALYGDAAAFWLQPDVDGGAVAEVRLPYHTDADLVLHG